MSKRQSQAMTLSEKLWLDAQAPHKGSIIDHADAMHSSLGRPLGHYYTDADDDRGVLITLVVLLIAFALTFGAGVLCGRVWA